MAKPRRLLLYILFFYSLNGFADAIKATESNDRLILQTSQGNRTLFGGADFAGMNDYSITIPRRTEHSKDEVRSPIEVNSVVSAVKKIDHSPENLDEINALYFEGRFETALARIENFLDDNPKHVRGLLMKGSLLYVLGQEARGREAWTLAKKIEASQ